MVATGAVVARGAGVVVVGPSENTTSGVVTVVAVGGRVVVVAGVDARAGAGAGTVAATATELVVVELRPNGSVGLAATPAATSSPGTVVELDVVITTVLGVRFGRVALARGVRRDESFDVGGEEEADDCDAHHEDEEGVHPDSGVSGVPPLPQPILRPWTAEGRVPPHG